MHDVGCWWRHFSPFRSGFHRFIRHFVHLVGISYTVATVGNVLCVFVAVFTNIWCELDAIICNALSEFVAIIGNGLNFVVAIFGNIWCIFNAIICNTLCELVAIIGNGLCVFVAIDVRTFHILSAAVVRTLHVLSAAVVRTFHVLRAAVGRTLHIFIAVIGRTVRGRFQRAIWIKWLVIFLGHVSHVINTFICGILRDVTTVFFSVHVTYVSFFTDVRRRVLRQIKRLWFSG